MPSIIRWLNNPDNCAEVVKQYLYAVGINVTDTSINTITKEHPDYPSLLTVGDTLQDFGVDNISMSLSPDKLRTLPLPFIAHIYGNKDFPNLFTVVFNIEKENIYYFDPLLGRRVRTTLDNFKSSYKGTVLIGETTDISGEKDYYNKRNTEKANRALRLLSILILPVLLLSEFIASTSIFNSASIAHLSYILLLLIGCVVTAMLVTYDLDGVNPFLQQICTAGRKTNCDAVLKSKGASIYGISWSVIGLSYFLGSTLFMLFNRPITESFSILSFMSLLASPYIIYSIWYQWKVIKQWCVMCLTVQIILLSLSILSLSLGSLTLRNISILSIITVLGCYIIPLIILSQLVPLIIKSKEANSYRQALQRIKHDPNIFNALLTKQKQYSYRPLENIGIKLGNPDGNIHILKVCNPHCKPCSVSHKAMEDLIKNNPDVDLQIVYLASNQPLDINSKPVKHFLELTKHYDKDFIHEAINDWYFAERKDYDSFASKYPIGNLDTEYAELDYMHRWCMDNEITHTPTFFINGYRLPPNYSIADIKYFLSV